MTALNKALHCLRPLVEFENWDYLVVWKLGDDPSRFIQWVGCCCSGAHGVCENVKEEKTEESRVGSLCKDTFIKHSAKSKACCELAKLPHSIPLYSGVHGETVITTETRWLSSCTRDSSSNLCQELTGTRVLIPVFGGLVELFTTRNVPKDEKIIEFVTSLCMIKMEDEPVALQSYADTNLSVQPRISLIDQFSRNGTFLLNNFNSNYDTESPIIPTVPQLSNYPCLEGSSTGSNPAHEHLSLNSYSGHASPNASVNELIEKRQIHTTPNRDSNVNLENEFVSAVECVSHNGLIERENVNSGLKMEKEKYQSKNLVTERNRRNRIKDGLLTLRSLVPKISKMDKASILVDAISYIQELHEEKKQLENELKETTAEQSNKKTNPLGSNSGKGENPKKRNRDQSSAQEMKQFPVQVEVNQIGKRDFLIKLLSAHKEGGFVRLIEGLHFLGLQVIDANTTTCDGQMMNIFKVEVNKTGVHPKVLKESLIELTSGTIKC